MTQGPILFDLHDDTAPLPKVSEAPPVPDAEPIGAGSAVERASLLAARPPSRLARWFWGVLLAVLGAVISLALWDFATQLVARMPVLGWAVTGGLVVAAGLALLMLLREGLALLRLRRVDALRRAAVGLRQTPAVQMAGAQALAERIRGFYAHRKDLSWQLARFDEHRAEVMDGDALLDLLEVDLLAPLDARALTEVEAAARQVAMVTALVPLALADVVVALVASVRMIRRVAEIYGGRSGLFGSWRLMRAVLAHLVATGAVAAGDDLLDTVLGGSVLSKISRRFGEGVVNGALSARVGLAAMEVCRPMPFVAQKKPATRRVVQRALAGLFSTAKTGKTQAR